VSGTVILTKTGHDTLAFPQPFGAAHFSEQAAIQWSLNQHTAFYRNASKYECVTMPRWSMTGCET